MECTQDKTLQSTFPSKTRIAIFASGRGSNAMALIKTAREKNLSRVEIVCLVSDNPDAHALEMAQANSIEAAVFMPPVSKALKQKARQRLHEEQILEYLKKQKIDLVLLAGYMRMIGPTLIDYFFDEKMGVSRIVNIHPSLLPAFPGKDAYQQAFFSGKKEFGCSVHFVDNGMDTGPIVFQRKFDKGEATSVQEIVIKGLHEEHLLYGHFLQCWNDGVIMQSFKKPMARSTAWLH